MNFKDIIKKELLFEGKKSTSSGSIKIFYDIDIKIKNEEVVEPTPPPQEAAAPPPSAVPAPEAMPVAIPLPQTNLPVQESINEEEGEDIVKKIEGVLTLTNEDVDNIQTLEDLIDYLGDKKHKGEDILDDLTIEVIMSLIGNPEAMKTNDVIKKDDQIIINISYGYKKEDSVGIKVLKRRGVNSVSIIMLKDNDILDTVFDIKKFNSQIVEYRNDSLKK